MLERGVYLASLLCVCRVISSFSPLLTTLDYFTEVHTASVVCSGGVAQTACYWETGATGIMLMLDLCNAFAVWTSIDYLQAY